MTTNQIILIAMGLLVFTIVTIRRKRYKDTSGTHGHSSKEITQPIYVDTDDLAVRIYERLSELNILSRSDIRHRAEAIFEITQTITKRLDSGALLTGLDASVLEGHPLYSELEQLRFNRRYDSLCKLFIQSSDLDIMKTVVHTDRYRLPTEMTEAIREMTIRDNAIGQIITLSRLLESYLSDIGLNGRRCIGELEEGQTRYVLLVLLGAGDKDRALTSILGYLAKLMEDSYSIDMSYPEIIQPRTT